VIDARSHKIVDANPFALKLMGRTRQEVLGQVCHRFICPAEIGKCPISDLGQTVDGSERQLVCASGARSAILKTVVPFAAKGQELLIESFIDMTSLKAAQEQLKAAVLAADTANRAKSEFLANMSHELRTPLNHIIGFTELVAGKDFGELNEVQEEYLTDVLSSSKHLLSLINDILDLSKVEAGRMELELSEVKLALVLENSLVMIKEKAAKHSLRISTEIGDLPETIAADERKVKQIVYNLLSNAVKFTADGGEIRLSADCVPAIPAVSGDNGDKATGQDGSGGGAAPAMIRIAVADTGIGLEPQDLERIFRPFEQADASIGRKYQGTGLGLSLTQKLVALHGGTIWAESEGPGRGAAFFFTLSTQMAKGARGDDLGQ
jgi:signal transduction histidine kinase